jgi:hypothetical protein
MPAFGLIMPHDPQERDSNVPRPPRLGVFERAALLGLSSPPSLTIEAAGAIVGPAALVVVHATRYPEQKEEKREGKKGGKRRSSEEGGKA